MLKGTFIAAAFLAAFPVWAAGNRPTVIDTFDDWSAFSVAEGKGKVCYAASLPKKQEGFSGKRGDVYLMVSHRPAEKRVGEVSVTAGYDYKPNGPVSLEVGGQNFGLYTNGDTAWSDKDDAKIVAAMKKGGGNIVVRGVSAKGMKTVDTYSLKGVAAALTAIGTACGVK